MNNEVMFSSKKDEWGTPKEFYKEWDDIYHFSVDVCASKENAKCPIYLTKEENALAQNWGDPGSWVWCNPPYGRDVIKWLDKAEEERQKGVSTVMLLPARTDTRWFHKYINVVRLIFIKGRLTFEGASAPAPFPSVIMIFEAGENA